MRRLFLLLAAFLFAAPALAEGPAKPPKAPPGTSLEMPFLAVPMSNKDGKLLGYSFISSKLVCASQAAAVKARLKIPFLQDANVRDVHARPVSKSDDPTAVDKDLLAAHLTQNAKRVLGDSQVVRTDVLQVQYMPLHPSESPQPAAPPPAPANGQGTPPAQNAGTSGTAGGAAGTSSTAGNATAATSQPRPGTAH
jgi:hypothetical protein